jgi:hypothetical protein
MNPAPGSDVIAIKCGVSIPQPLAKNIRIATTAA